MSSFTEKFKKERESSGRNTDFYKFKDGDTRIRILQEPVTLSEYFDKRKGKYFTLWTDSGLKGSVKYLTRCWLYGKGDVESKMVLIKIPYKVMEKVVDLMGSEEYYAEGFPIPYDITVSLKNGRTLDAEYSVIPARANTPVPEAAYQALEGQKPLEDILSSMKEKSKKNWEEAMALESSKEVDEDVVEYPVDDINPNDIPF